MKRPLSYMWSDLTTDYRTNHYVGKDIIKVISFLFSLLLSLLTVAAKWVSDKDLGITDLIALFLLASLGAAGIKLADHFYRRKTADDQGGALTVPTDELDPTAQPPFPLANPKDEKCKPTADPTSSL